MLIRRIFLFSRIIIFVLFVFLICAWLFLHFLLFWRSHNTLVWCSLISLTGMTWPHSLKKSMHVKPTHSDNCSGPAGTTETASLSLEDRDHHLPSVTWKTPHPCRIQQDHFDNGFFCSLFWSPQSQQHEMLEQPHQHLSQRLVEVRVHWTLLEERVSAPVLFWLVHLSST